MPIASGASSRSVSASLMRESAASIARAASKPAWPGFGSGRGAPKNAITPSPMNSLTVPPCACTTSVAVSNSVLSIAVTRSGASLSTRVVKPRTSMNMTQTKRRWLVMPSSRPASSSVMTSGLT